MPFPVHLTPRESQKLSLAARDVPAAYQAMLAGLRDVGARIITSQLNEQNKQDIQGVLEFEIPTDKQQRESVEKALASAGVVFGRDVSRAPDTQQTIETKVRMSVRFVNADTLPPREQSRLMMKVSDVDKSADAVRDIVVKAGGRIVNTQRNADSSGEMSTHLLIDVPLDQADFVRSSIKNLGAARVDETSTNQQSPEGALARARLEVTLANIDQIVSGDQGLGQSLRHALSLSVKGLLWTVQVLVMGLLLVGPWLLIGWGAVKLARKSRKPASEPAK